MTNREKKLRRKIELECWSFESNFSGMDILMKMENDWHVAQKEGNYSFDNCPSTFKCLEDYLGLCEERMSEYSPEQCKECWEKALRGE